MWKAPVLRGPVLLQGCSEKLSLKQLRQGILEISQRLGQAGSWAKSTQCPFFPSGDRVLVLHRMVGRSWRPVLTPGYFDRVAFLQILCVRISASPPHPHMSPRLHKSPSAESTPP